MGRNLGGRGYLVSKLGEQGLSRRRAVAVVNAILDVMVMVLRRGKDVEFPFGRLTRVRRQFGARWDRYDDWPAHLDPYTIQWIPSWQGLKELLGPEAAEAEAGEFMSDRAFLEEYLAEHDQRRRKKKAGNRSGVVNK